MTQVQTRLLPGEHYPTEDWSSARGTVRFYCYFCVASLELQSHELVKVSAKHWKKLRERRCPGYSVYSIENCDWLFEKIRTEVLDA